MDATNVPVSRLKLEYLSPNALQPDPKNPRKHSNEQTKALARAMGEFGFTNPVLADKTGVVIAGHCRLLAAKELGITSIPVIRLENLTQAQVKAYRIADNRLAEMGTWDMEFLKDELQALTEIDASFDLTLTGFETAKIDMFLNPGEDPEEDEVPPPANGPAISRLGDLFILGQHKLVCGDALKSESYEHLLGVEKADLVFTDSPYNVPTGGHILKDNKHGHEDFAMAAGEMSDEQFEAFLRRAITQLQLFSTSGSIHYICMDWRHIAILIMAGKSYEELKNICVWNKSNGGMGSLYRSKHELIAVFKNGKEPHINNIELGKHGRNRTNVWDYAGQSSMSTKRDKELAMHPTVKPVAMIADAIMDCSERDQIVLDPFGGSGSTLIAAEKTHRCARLIELEPKYVDVTVRRWQNLTGLKAVLVTTGQTFDELAKECQGGVA
jgi:DNA modification methylase